MTRYTSQTSQTHADPVVAARSHFAPRPYSTLQAPTMADLLGVPCDRHEAPPGEPCFTRPSGCCASRVHVAGYGPPIPSREEPS